MSFGLLLLWVLAVVGTIGIFGSVFYLSFIHYEQNEVTVRKLIADYAAQIYDYLDRMFKRQPLDRCYLMIIVPTVTLALMGLAMGFRFGLLEGLMLGFAFGFIGFKLPGKIVRTMFEKRVAKFDKQLVDALNMMSNAIKSGLSFMQVVQVIEREMPNPCSEEFGMVLKENRVGINLNDALMNMTKRIPSEDLFMIINSVVTLSQQGGDLSEAFDTIATTIRERQRVAEKIRTLAQAGITQGIILSSLPIIMMALQWFIQPDLLRLLFVTPVGWGLLGLMCFLIVGGALWMKRILTIEI